MKNPFKFRKTEPTPPPPATPDHETLARLDRLIELQHATARAALLLVRCSAATAAKQKHAAELRDIEAAIRRQP